MITLSGIWSVGLEREISYGLLYNGYAVTDPRNIANTGWHVPTQTEINSLVTYLGGSSVAGGKLKQTGTLYWKTPNTGATNEVSFNARGSGVRDATSGGFSALQVSTDFWSSTIGTSSPYVLELNYSSIVCAVFKQDNINYGVSVRLVKDSTTLSHGQNSIYIGNDGRVYQTICIDTLEWTLYNIIETKYRNGDTIPEITDNTTWAALDSGALCAYNNNWNNVFGNSIVWVVISSGLSFYRKGIRDGYYVIDYSNDGGNTWELNLVVLEMDEYSIIINIDSGISGYRQVVRDNDYCIDLTLDEIGFLGTEGINWINVYKIEK